MERKEIDGFARIGNQKTFYREDLLEEKIPADLPEIYLPVKDHLSGATFKPKERMNTAEELNDELIRQRGEHSKYLLNLAPSIESRRLRINIEEFNWRIQEDTDLLNFSATLTGSGKWHKVSIPHFGPPLGQAVTIYHTTVNISAEMLDIGAIFICFKSVDYIAEVFVNEYPVGSHEGFFAPFEFDITQVAREGRNHLLVLVKNDFIARGNPDDNGEVHCGDKIYGATNLGYDDSVLGWHHGPPAMGIYQDVYLEARSVIHIRDIFVRPLPDGKKAEAWIEISNARSQETDITLDLSLYGQNFKETIFENQIFTPETYIVAGSGDLAKPEHNQQVRLKMEKGINYLKVPLDIPEPRLWNPDTPWLYQLQVKVLDTLGSCLDAMARQFGMRVFSMDTVSGIKGKLYLNGNEIRLRGANTMGHLQQCVFRKNWDQLIDDILLAKIAHMNFLRFTQRPVQPEIYEFCDKLGLMTQTDLPVFGVLRRNKVAEAIKQAGEMERLVRNHPCNIMVTYINERFPNGEGKPHRHLNNPSEYKKFFEAADQVILLENPDRIIKAGDGDYDPPSPGLPDSHCYNGWYNGHGLPLGKLIKGYWQRIKPDWYFGCGEFGAEGLDPINLMEKYYPRDWLPVPGDDEKCWTPGEISKCQTYDFHFMWFDTPDTIENWIEASQAHQEWVIKYMTEAFRRDSRMVSFAVHLFIDAWPAGWMKSIMDVDRQPKKAFFAYRDALEPLMVSIRTDKSKFYSGETMRLEAWISNDLNTVPESVWMNYQFEQNGRVLFSNKVLAKIPSNSSQFQGYIDWSAPLVAERTLYTLRIGIFNDQKVSLHQNSLVVEVFPREKQNPQKKKVFVVAKQGGEASALADEAEWLLTENLDEADVMIAEAFEDFNSQSEQYLKWVSAGKIALFLKLVPGQYELAGTMVTVKGCTMGSYFFVSRGTGHPLVKDFKPKDFFCWYNSRNDIISPIIEATFQAEGWNTILSTGNTVWNKGSESAMAVSELSLGEGLLRICQLNLSGRIRHNPTAALFLEKLMNI